MIPKKVNKHHFSLTRHMNTAQTTNKYYYFNLYAVPLLIILLLLLPGTRSVCLAQINEFKVVVNADQPDWMYKTGEQVTFSVAVLKGDEVIKNVKFNYSIGLERMSPQKEGTLVSAKERVLIEGGSLSKPGFLRCVVTVEIEGKRYRGLATAAFSPERIEPSEKIPDDFLKFWNKAKSEAAKIPMDARMNLLTELCTEKVDVYGVNFQNFKSGSRIYGVLSVPKKAGKYPAVLKVPGAGVRPYGPDVAMAEKGLIVLQIGIHGIPVDMADSTYMQLAAGSLKGYPGFNSNSRDEYYYKRVFMGCIRANDFLYSLPSFDRKTLAVVGGSQGGALSIVTAALDKRVNYLIAYFPAMCDHTGYLHGRTGGWPHLLENKDTISKNQIETLKYYDVVNFASLLKVPGLYSWGFNDEVCPPTSIYAAYNLIRAPKELLIAKESGHEYVKEQKIRMDSWLQETLALED